LAQPLDKPGAKYQPDHVLTDEALRLALEDGRSAVVPIVQGDASMAPLLRGGDAVVAAAVGPAGPVRGDIVVFRQNDYLVIHRYLGRARAADGTPCLRTRGDGKNRLDPPLAAANLLGRAIAVRRNGAWRSLEGPGARLFRSAMAWHALFWAGAGAWARRAGLGGAIAALDLALLAATVRCAFAVLHARIPGPPDDGPAKTA
jgi:hypothetical protein